MIFSDYNLGRSKFFIPQCHYSRRRLAKFPYPTPHLTLPLHLNSPSLISVTVICQCRSLQDSAQNFSLSVDNDYISTLCFTLVTDYLEWPPFFLQLEERYCQNSIHTGRHLVDMCVPLWVKKIEFMLIRERGKSLLFIDKCELPIK